MKTFRISFFLLVSSFVFLLSSCSNDQVVQLDSPDGRNNIVFILKDGIPFYKVMRDNRVIIDTSGLGFDLKDMPSLRGNFKMEQATLSGDRERWEPAWGQWNRINDHHSRLLVTLKEQVELHRIMQIEFKAFDDGVGFRYLIPEQTGLARLEIMQESTEFCFLEGWGYMLLKQAMSARSGRWASTITGSGWLITWP